MLAAVKIIFGARRFSPALNLFRNRYLPTNMSPSKRKNIDDAATEDNSKKLKLNTDDDDTEDNSKKLKLNTDDDDTEDNSKKLKLNTDDASTEDNSKKLKLDTEKSTEETNASVDSEDSAKKWNLKIGSWNVNGVRAWLGKNGLDFLKRESLDIFCLQETKCSTSKIPKECKIEGYFDYWNSAETEGYSGCGFYSKTKPLSVTNGIGIEKHDSEGRVITAEYDTYYLVTSYVPNAGKKCVRLEYRSKEWDVDFLEYLKKLEEKKPVILCGDLNVAHKEIDLKNPKTNKKNAGFTIEERDGFTNILENGFVDSYRHLYPDKEGAYTFWTYMMNARAKDVGWRLDYFVISEKLTPKLCDSLIHKDEMGSDHCPVVLLMNM